MKENKKEKEKKPVDTSKISGGLNSIPQGGGDKPTTIIKDKKDINIF